MREMSIEERRHGRMQAWKEGGTNRGSGARGSRNQCMADTLPPTNRSVLGVDGY